MLLVGDIGGTKTHLALYEGTRLIKDEIFQSRHFKTLDEILRQFLDRPIEKCCLAIAGPIQNQTAKLTNLPWEIDRKKLETTLATSRIHLLNDLEATAWGIKNLKKEDLVSLNPGIKQSGNQAVVAAGTGLGIAGLWWDGKSHHPFATEGGHADFGPRTPEQFELWNYLHKKYGHVSIERVVSGQGLEHLYWFLAEKKRWKSPYSGEDLPKHILENASTSELCGEVLTEFCSMYGAIAGNTAVQFLATGGIYLAGGIAPKMLSHLQKGEFMRAFGDKGRMKELVLQIPVYVVLNEKLPLMGALVYANLI